MNTQTIVAAHTTAEAQAAALRKAVWAGSNKTKDVTVFTAKVTGSYLSGFWKGLKG